MESGLSGTCDGGEGEVEYMQYSSEEVLQGIIDLISLDLSEPYSIFTYRYFINNWPQLCYLAIVREPSKETPTVVGAIVCKQDTHRSGAMRGYIAMLAVRRPTRMWFICYAHSFDMSLAYTGCDI